MGDMKHLRHDLKKTGIYDEYTGNMRKVNIAEASVEGKFALWQEQ